MKRVLVQAGTSSEYGYNCTAPAETAELQPNSDYAVSKVATSYLLGHYGRTKHFPCTHLRLYSVLRPVGGTRPPDRHPGASWLAGPVPAAGEPR